MFENQFFGTHATSRGEYKRAIESCLEAILHAMPTSSYQGGSPASLTEKLPAWREDGGPMEFAMKDLEAVIASSVAVYHPETCAHLHCPVVIPALCAELVLTALNQSMDSFDQAPAATLIEQQVCDWIQQLVGYDSGAAAAFTTGGTQSNYYGLMLARDRWVQKRWNQSVQESGIPAQAIGRMKILCSESAHFSVVKAAHQLGLGGAAVITVPVDAQARMIPAELAQLTGEIHANGDEVFAVVATAGTTDAGAIDPLATIGDICAAHRIWLHVDAAWGSALLISAQHRQRLSGIELADSVSVDFHKGFYQPISCAAFVVKNSADFDLVRFHADYLNPEEHETQGVPDLVTHSLLTTRRFDSLKIWMTLRVVGVERLGEMVDRTLALAQEVAHFIGLSSKLELVCEPSLCSVLFRLSAEAGESAGELEELHAELPTQLLHEGHGVIGFSKMSGRRIFKLTLLNPCLEKEQVFTLLDRIVESADRARTSRTSPAVLLPA